MSPHSKNDRIATGVEPPRRKLVFRRVATKPVSSRRIDVDRPISAAQEPANAMNTPQIPSNSEKLPWPVPFVSER